MKFQYTSGARLRVAEKIAGPELLKLSEGRGLDGLEASEVVEAAKDESSPLHPIFDWNDTEAAASWRNSQARLLLRSIRVLVIAPTTAMAAPVRVFVSMGPGAGYIRTTVAVKDIVTRTRLLDAALADVKSARARLAELKGLDGLLGALVEVEQAIIAAIAA